MFAYNSSQTYRSVGAIKFHLSLFFFFAVLLSYGFVHSMNKTIDSMVEVFKRGEISKSSNPAGVLHVNFQGIQEEFVVETLLQDQV